MSHIKVILFGLNYELNEHISTLGGCINDIQKMSTFLQTTFSVPAANIGAYHDHTDLTPTRDNILNVLQQGVEAVNSPDNDLTTLWVHYSGHGSYVTDDNGDDTGGYDEVLCPLDGGFIRDDDLHTLFSQMHSDTHLVCIFDCCHSGTALDLPYHYNHKTNKCDKISSSCHIRCKALLLSGCREEEVAADVHGILTRHTFNGAFTAALLHGLKYAPSLNIDNLFTQAYSFLQQNHLGQRPQITSSYPITDSTILLRSQVNLLFQKRLRQLQYYIRLCLYYYRKTLNKHYLKLRYQYYVQLQQLLKSVQQ